MDTVHGAGGNDFIDTVNDPPSRDLVHCPGWDEVQADPEDYVNEDCEKVQRIDLSQGPQPPKERPSTCRPPARAPEFIYPFAGKGFLRSLPEERMANRRRCGAPVSSP